MSNARATWKELLLSWLVCALVGAFLGAAVAAYKMKMYFDLFCAP